MHQHVKRILGQARRRLWLRTFVVTLGWALAGVALLAVSGIVAGQVGGWRLPWVTLLLPAGAGFAVLLVGVVAAVRLPSEKVVATLVDERLGLKDRLGTSLYAATLPESELREAVLGDAQQAAAGLRPGLAFPLSSPQAGRSWLTACGLAGLVAVALWDPFGLAAWSQQRAAEQLAEAQRQAEIAAVLAQARQEVQTLADQEPENRGNDQTLSATELEEQLQAMLTQRDLSNPAEQQAAAAEVSDLQERFAPEVAAQQAAAERMAALMSQLDTGEPGPADPFADALRRGDFEAAQQELAKLADDLSAAETGDSGAMSADQKAALQQQMAAMAEQLQQLAENQQQAAGEASPQMQQALQDAGLTPEQQQQAMQQSQSGASAEQMQQMLEQALQQSQNMSPQQAQQMAQQLQQQMQQAQQNAQQNQQAGDAAQNMAQQMQRMQDALQQASESGQQNPQGQQQLSEAMQQMQQQLGQCAGQQRQAQGMQDAQQRLQEAMQQLAQRGQGQPQPGGQPGNQPGQPGQSAGGNGTGPGEGDGTGGAMLGQERPELGTASHAASDTQEGQGGRVLSSWSRDGQMSSGQAKITYNQAVTEARAEAERAVSEDRTPARYHSAIREYFGNLPATPDGASP